MTTSCREIYPTKHDFDGRWSGKYWFIRLVRSGKMPSNGLKIR
jgi:hypothetical protein